MCIYRKRLAENILNEKLNSSGCVLVTGPKFCGKTTLCQRFAKSSVSLKNGNTIALANSDPKGVLKGEYPRLIDEWQKAPELWNEIKADLDEDYRFGKYIITETITARKKRKLLWIMAFVTFFMSAVLDNLTTTIIMVTMVGCLLKKQNERWIFSSVIVIAANSGGAFSPIGDVTTIMLWMGDKVSTGQLITTLLIPSLVSMVVPLLIATRMIDNDELPHCDEAQNKNRVIYRRFPSVSKFVLVVGVCSLLFVPVFKTLTGLPPFMGIIISLGFIWLITEIIVRRYKIESGLGARVDQAAKGIDMSTILFFLGILMAVSVLSEAGILGNLAQTMDEGIHEPFAMTTLIGYLSAVIDNVLSLSLVSRLFLSTLLTYQTLLFRSLFSLS